VKGTFTMKNKETETKFKSARRIAHYLFSRVTCLGALALICSSAPAQNLFMLGYDGQTGFIFEFTPDGVRSTFASGLNSPGSLTFDSAGNLFVADSGAIYKFTPDGVRTTFALGVNSAGMVLDKVGNLFVADYSSDSILKFTPDGLRSIFALGLSSPHNPVLDGAGNLFVLDGGGGGGNAPQAIYKFTPDGVRSAFPASDLYYVVSPVVDSAGNLFVADYSSDSILKFTPDGVRTTFASGSGLLQGGLLIWSTRLACDSAGNLFVSVYGDGVKGGGIGGPGPVVYKFTPAGVRSTFASGLNAPLDLVFDSEGNLFVADDTVTDSSETKVFPGAIYKFTPHGNRSTLASLPVGQVYNLAIQPTLTATAPVPMPAVTVGVSASSVTEGADATFTLSASTINPSQVTTVHYAMSGKAKAGMNYTLSGVIGEADIPAGASSTGVTLHATTAGGKNMKATLKLVSGSNYRLSKPKQATVTIVNMP
jgi:hypothetical protein